MRKAFAAAFALGTLGCRAELPLAEPTLRAEFVAAPAVRCIRITAVGATRNVSRDFAASAGSTAQSVVLGGLPTGDVLVSGRAFDVACTELATQHPTWVADTVRQTLGAGANVTIALVF